MALLWFFAGFVLLVLGAELLVRGGAGFAGALGISPLVIGLTIVAYGTSTPELAVSIGAGLRGQDDIALGNVVGSNIFNVLFILGVSAMVRPLGISRQLIRRDVPLMIMATLLAVALCFDGRIGRVDGLLLTAGLALYTGILVRGSRKDVPVAPPGEETNARPRCAVTFSRLMLHLACCAAGLGILVLGTRWFVDGAVGMARLLGVSELVIGLTVVAAGTSMPEAFTSVIATLRGQREIAVGNVIGSNIYNLLAILGISSLVTPGGLAVAPALNAFDIPVMTLVAIACLPIFYTGSSIARWEGGLLLAYYATYTVYLVLRAGHHDMLGPFSHAMIWFIAPLTILVLLLSVIRAIRRSGETSVGRR